MAVSTIIPKEQLSAYQRWELGSFDATPSSRSAAAEREQVALAQARAQGYEAGQREGFEAGRRLGLEAGQREALADAMPRVARLDEMLCALQADLTRVDRELSRDVVQLGLAVARNLVQASLKLQPELVQGCVEEALRQLGQHHSPTHLTVHPEDAVFVRGILELRGGPGAWSLREDPTIARGGCRVENGSGEIDATLEQRWHRTTAALGQPLDWIE